MDKQKIHQAILQQLDEDIEHATQSRDHHARASQEAPGPKESRFDTSRDELSRVAGAQTLRMSHMERIGSVLRSVNIKPATTGQVGAFLTVDEAGQTKYFFIVPEGAGGYVIDQLNIQTVAVNTPVGRAFIGAKAGDTVTARVPAGNRAFRVVAVE